MNADKVRELLAAQCKLADGQGNWAEEHGLSPAYVSDVIRGRRDPGQSILDALGLECEMTYRKIG